MTTTKRLTRAQFEQMARAYFEQHPEHLVDSDEDEGAFEGCVEPFDYEAECRG